MATFYYTIIYIALAVLIIIFIVRPIIIRTENIVLSIILIILTMCVSFLAPYPFFKDQLKNENIQAKKELHEIQNAKNMLEYEFLIKKYGGLHLFQWGAITLARLNMRSGPGTQNDIIITIPEGEIVSFTDGSYGNKKDGWYKIVYDRKVGWVYGKYIKPAQGKKAYGRIEFGFDIILRYLFPERSGWSKFLGIFFGLVIGVITYTFFYEAEKVGYLTFAITCCYFTIKNLAMIKILTFLDYGLTLFFIAIFTVSISEISKIIVRFIKR